MIIKIENFILNNMYLVQKYFMFAFFFFISYFIFYYYIKNNKIKNKYNNLYYRLISIFYKTNIFELYFIMFTIISIIKLLYFTILMLILVKWGDIFYVNLEIINSNLVYLGYDLIDISLINSNIELNDSTHLSESVKSDSNIKTTNPSSSATSNNTTNPSSSVTSTNTNTTAPTSEPIPGPSQTPNIPSSTAVAITAGGDAAIMTAGVSLGKVIAKAATTPAGKVLATSSGVAIGAVAIALKNISSNLSQNIGKNDETKLLNFDDILSNFLNLTGNSVLDLLNLILLLKKFELIYIYLLVYNLSILNLDNNKIENWLNTYIPNTGKYIYRFITYTKKASKFIIIISLIFLVLSSINSYYYLNYFVENFDSIIEYYNSIKK